MSEKNRTETGRSGSALFLMEMIFAVFFFMLCVSVCILAFAKSDRMSREARNLNRGILAAESAAEVFRANGPEGLVSVLSYEKKDESTYTALLSGDREELSVTAELSGEGDGMTSALIRVRTAGADASEEDLFALTVKRYVRPDASEQKGGSTDGET